MTIYLVIDIYQRIILPTLTTKDTRLFFPQYLIIRLSVCLPSSLSSFKNLSDGGAAAVGPPLLHCLFPGNLQERKEGGYGYYYLKSQNSFWTLDLVACKIIYLQERLTQVSEHHASESVILCICPLSQLFSTRIFLYRQHPTPLLG